MIVTCEEFASSLPGCFFSVFQYHKEIVKRYNAQKKRVACLPFLHLLLFYLFYVHSSLAPLRGFPSTFHIIVKAVMEPTCCVLCEGHVAKSLTQWKPLKYGAWHATSDGYELTVCSIVVVCGACVREECRHSRKDWESTLSHCTDENGWLKPALWIAWKKMNPGWDTSLKARVVKKMQPFPVWLRRIQQDI